MKKTSLLSLLTAAAIVATSAGTYAVWDQLDATQKTGGSVIIESGTKIVISDALTGFGVLNGTTDSTSATFDVNVTDQPAGKTKIKFTVLNDQGTVMNSSNITYTIEDSANQEVAAEGIAIPSGNTTYKVVATLKNKETSPASDTTEAVKVKVELID